MPSNNGTSSRGLQIIVNAPNVANRSITLIPTNVTFEDRLTRLGTMLLCFQTAEETYPVLGVWKVYGNGLIVPIAPDVPGLPLEVWVNWFVAGIQWAALTPG